MLSDTQAQPAGGSDERSRPRLLLVEDDTKLAATLRRGLLSEGYEIDIAGDGPAALSECNVHDYDAIVLDVMLPGIDGHEVCRELRGRDRWTPVLMLTALGDVSDRIRGLDTGADDYMIKPFDFGELLARLRALIRRGPSHNLAPLHVGELIADPHSQVVTWAGHEAKLTPREYELLEYLIRRPNQVVPRAQLLEHVWSADFEGSPNVVDVYIGYLRRKLESPSSPQLLRTVRGSGFMLTPGGGQEN